MSSNQLILTEDGSNSVYHSVLKETYHSIHGAIQESNHVFLETGLFEMGKQKSTLRILEIGFGTGLNCFLTYLASNQRQIEVIYTALEPFPVDAILIDSLNYPEQLGEERTVFNQVHKLHHGSQHLNANFLVDRWKCTLAEKSLDRGYNLIYFDAFSPDVQPELWTEEVFLKMYACLSPGGILVTYCAKGEIKRIMKKAGFLIERLPGPPGKREMTRARKEF